MSESTAILEGEVARRFNPVDKLRATNQDSSVSDWVPSDTLDLGSLMASENNLYLANLDDDCDAYEEVEVDVSTDLEDADDLTKATTKITGKDPNLDPNNDYAAGVDENGNLTKEMIPAAIHIVVKPRKLKYEEGETLDFTGIHVYLMDGNNKRYTDSSYPTGEIPFGELMFPVTIAEGEGQGGSSATIDDQTFIAPNVIQVPLPLNKGLVYGTPENPEQRYTITSSSEAYFVLADNGSSIQCQIVTVGSGSYHIKYENIDNPSRNWERDEYVGASGTTIFKNIPFGFGRMFSLDKSVIGTQYYINGITASIIERDIEYARKLATIIIDGTINQTGVEIPVEWIRTDGEILEDTFEIEVGEGGEPDPPQPDPWAGSADVSWGGHHYNINRRLVPPVQYSNGYCWRQQAGEYIVEYTVEQATKFGWLILIR